MRISIIFIFFSYTVFSQVPVDGVIFSEDGVEPLEGVTVINLKGNEWTVSNEKGEFNFLVENSDFEIQFKILGRAPFLLSDEDFLKRTSDSIFLHPDNLRLDEVRVTAVPKRSKIGSAISLGEYALSQVQSYSLSDILKQLPGQEITPPSLNASNSISLRTAQPNSINSFGVSYLLDGVKLSNDENMQSYNSSSGLTSYDNLNSGIDLRTIPASNIEEVEVISGIPDAKYGDLTSGLIKINRKAGVTPFTINSSIRQGNTAVSLSKGVRLTNFGNLSLSLDYLNANSDPRNSLEQYNRITASVIWSVYNASKTLRNTLSLTLHNNLDDTNYDKDNDDGGKDAKFRKDRGIHLSNRFNWKPNSNFIDNFNFTLGYSYSYQHSFAQSFKNDGGRVVPQSMETGLFTAGYTPVAYLQVKEVYGQPINLSATTSIDKEFSSNKLRQNVSFGLNTSYSDNRGKGKSYDPKNAHTQVTLSGGGSSLSSGEGIRALDYDGYVKPRVNIGLYAQDNITWKFESGKELYANLGLRYDIQNAYSSYSPRINLGYELTKKISIRGGLGFASKAPSLAQIYPGDKYFDILIRDFRTSSYSFNLVQTYKKELDKIQLEPSKSWKYEVGFNYNPSFGNFAFTAYYNHTFDGITGYNELEKVAFPIVEFDFSIPNMPPNYVVSGYSPYILSYSLSKNAQQIVDKGIEFYLNFRKIEAINTSLSLNGSYTYTRSVSELEKMKKNNNVLEEDILYGFYNGLPSKSDRLRLRATITHHLSELGLLLSLTAEQFTQENIYASTSNIYPTAYLNANAERIEIAEEEKGDSKYDGLLLSPSEAKDKKTPAYHNFHLRATKELLNGLSMSVYANNFLNYHPVVTVDETSSKRNSLISFGAQIKYQF
ncbi:TonB-dependent receptor [Gillisia sp. M10.2A]|uniref:TonB-dependent receptor n=1 Tax=Gillisia lutea TaxID=2909668 RepID=A0ABS9EHK9_9FLAO|nr:TonB-dependent receptor [Gillisia lutea]MCF4102353.1 TonB-dependent receptor [Gillisia lutea]